MKHTERCVLPKMAEVLADGFCLATKRRADENQAEQCSCLGKSKEVLDDCASLDTKNIHDGEEQDHCNGYEILAVQSHVHIAQRKWTNTPKRNVSNVPKPLVSRDNREQHTKK